MPSRIEKDLAALGIDAAARKGVEAGEAEAKACGEGLHVFIAGEVAAVAGATAVGGDEDAADGRGRFISTAARQRESGPAYSAVARRGL